MKTVCESGKCVGCMACLDVCCVHAISIHDDLKTYHAVIDQEKCINCGRCHKTCQNNNSLDLKKPMSWYQGWAKDQRVREQSSSGGFASAIALQFVRTGGIVCSCIFKDGQFVFDFATEESEVKKFTGSKYVKSNPVGTYKKIQSLLSSGQKVLFIGLPCQVGALKTFLLQKYQKELYTIDLICHGTPSPKNLSQFLQEHGFSIYKTKDVRFRMNENSYLQECGKRISPRGIYDRYILAFLNGVNYTENCYSCRYARLERISDITLGDSWGSELTDVEKTKGISLALCQTEKGEELLKKTNLYLKTVDLENAISNNHQLKEPFVKPKKYNLFFDLLQTGTKYDKAVGKIIPRTCFNQKMKYILRRFKTLKEVMYQITIIPNQK